MFTVFFPHRPKRKFFKRKNGKKESKEPVGARSRSAISPEGRRRAVMRMQVRADTTLAALLTRFELKISLIIYSRIPIFTLKKNFYEACSSLYSQTFFI